MKKLLLPMFAAAMLLSACDKDDDHTLKTWIIASEKPPKVLIDETVPVYYVKEKSDENWQTLIYGIHGFQYVPGFEYTVRVKVYELEPSASDAPAERYVLEKIISKVEKDSEGLPNTD